MIYDIEKSNISYFCRINEDNYCQKKSVIAYNIMKKSVNDISLTVIVYKLIYNKWSTKND